MEWPDPEGVYISELEPFTPDPHRITFVPQSSKGSYVWFERPSKLTLAERMGIPKGERNNGKILLSMQDLVPSKFTSVPGLKPVGGKMIADKVVNHPHILDRTRRLQQTYKRMIDPDYVSTNNWRKNRGDSPGMKIVDDIDVDITHTNSPTSSTENIGGYYNPSEDIIYVRRRGAPDAQASTAFHEDLHGYDFGRDEINDWIIKHLIDPEKVKGMSPRAQKYYLGSQEAPVHALQQGFIKGLDIGAPYPGDAAFDELLDSGIGGSLYYFKTQTPKDKRRLWRAMTGDLFVKKQGGKIKNPDH